MTDARQYAPATARNREPILQCLQSCLPPNSLVLEIASGTGEHGLYFADHLPSVTWQPSDIHPEAIASIQAWQAQSQNPRLSAPLTVDVESAQWWKHLEQALNASVPLNAIVNINMIHISPWSAAEGLFQGASELLPLGGVLFLYGPFKRGNIHTAESNAQFDASLQARNPAWGVRNLEEVVQLGQTKGLILQDVIPMPANNLSVIFKISQDAKK